MNNFLWARRLNNKKYKLSTCLFLFTLIFSSVTLAYDVEGYKNIPKTVDTTVRPVAKPSIGEQAEGCYCECENEKWVCYPADSDSCQLSGPCMGGLDASGVSLNSRTIPAVNDPRLTNPTRQIDPKKVPGDQFDPKAVPGDQFKR